MTSTELQAAHQQIARLSIENARLSETKKQAVKESRKWEARAKENYDASRRQQSIIVRRNQTIDALRVQLEERGI